jgi:hypothetical protein
MAGDTQLGTFFFVSVKETALLLRHGSEDCSELGESARPPVVNDTEVTT